MWYRAASILSEKYFGSIAEGRFYHVTSSRFTVLLLGLTALRPQRLAGRRGPGPEK